VKHGLVVTGQSHAYYLVFKVQTPRSASFLSSYPSCLPFLPFRTRMPQHRAVTSGLVPVFIMLFLYTPGGKPVSLVYTGLIAQAVF